MNSAPTPPNENEPYDANLDAQDEELAGGGGGGNRLALIAGAVLLLLVLGYWLVPKGQGGGLAGATPSFMLPDAAVSGATPAAPLDSATTTVAQPAPVPGAANPAVATTAPQTVVAPTTAPKTVVTAVSSDPVAPTAAPEPAAAPAPEAPAPAAAANQTLTGRITDENGKPLVGATVFLRGAGRGTSTDADGNYSIEVPAGDNKLVFGYGGYADEEVDSRGGKPVNVALAPDPKSGKRKKR